MIYLMMAVRFIIVLVVLLTGRGLFLILQNISPFEPMGAGGAYMILIFAFCLTSQFTKLAQSNGPLEKLDTNKDPDDEADRQPLGKERRALFPFWLRLHRTAPPPSTRSKARFWMLNTLQGSVLDVYNGMRKSGVLDSFGSCRVSVGVAPTQHMPHFFTSLRAYKPRTMTGVNRITARD